MKRGRQFPARALQRRWYTPPLPSVSLVMPPPVVRSKGYGPSKDLLRGVEAGRGLVIEAALHPADAEMQRRVLALTSHAAPVRVTTPLAPESEVNNNDNNNIIDTTVELEGAPQGTMLAIAPDQLASVASVIIDQVKEQLEKNEYTAEAAQAGHAGSIVNAVATCLRQEIERLVIANQTQEVSFARMLQENSNVICTKVANVIQAERLPILAEDINKNNEHLSLLIQEVSSAVTNLEYSLKEKFESSLAEIKKNDLDSEDVRVHVVTAIEQASRAQQEHLTTSLIDLLEERFKKESLPIIPPSLEEIQTVINSSLKKVVKDTQKEVKDLLQTIREKIIENSSDKPSAGESAIEGLLASYGERLEEMRDATSGLSDLKELMMELHSNQQSSVTEIHDVRDSVKKLKKELLNALREAVITAAKTGDNINNKEDENNEKSDHLAEYCDKLDALADRVTSTVEQQLKEKSTDFKELSVRLNELETTIREKQKPTVEYIPPPQEFDDSRMVALAQSISETILASLPSREETSVQSPQIPPTPPSLSLEQLKEISHFNKTDLVEAVAAALNPKLEELAEAVKISQRSDVILHHAKEHSPVIDEHQLVVLAQTISESVREVVQDTASNQKDALLKSFDDNVEEKRQRDQEEHKQYQQQQQTVIIERLEVIKENIITTVKEEMGRTHEVDLTPFQNYLDDIMGGMKEELSKQQEISQDKVKEVIEAISERFQRQQEEYEQRIKNEMEQKLKEKELQKTEKEEKQKNIDTEIKPPIFTTEAMVALNERLSNEIKGMITGEVSSLLSSLNNMQDEIREAAKQSPLALEDKLLSIENSLHVALTAEQDRNSRVQSALESVTSSIKNVELGNDFSVDTLKSINDAVANFTVQNTTAVNEIKAQLNTVDDRTESLQENIKTELSQRFSKLQEELLDGRRKIDELISSNTEQKIIIPTVESMRCKLDEVERIVENIASQQMKAIEDNNQEKQYHQQQQKQEKEEQKRQFQQNIIDYKGLETKIDLRLEGLFTSTREILSELQKYRTAQEEVISSITSTTNTTDNNNNKSDIVEDITLTIPPTSTPIPPPPLPTAPIQIDMLPVKENLEIMEKRLNDRLQSLQDALNELTLAENNLTSITEEVPPQQDTLTTEETKKQIEEIDYIIKLVKTSRSVHAKTMRDKLTVLRSFVASANLKTEENRDINQLLEALEVNRLKLKEDLTEVETELLEKVNSTIQQTLENFMTSIDQKVTTSTDSHENQLRTNLNSMESQLENHQQQIVIQLQDRIKDLEKLQGQNNVELTEVLKNVQNESREIIEQILKQDIPVNFRSILTEMCTEQLHKVQNRIDENVEQDEKNNLELLLKLQEVSSDVRQLGGLSQEVSEVVSSSSNKIMKELHRTHHGLMKTFEQHAKAVLQHKTTADLSNVVSYTSASTKGSSDTVLVQSTPLSIWWLLVLSFIVFFTIMGCAYFLFAAFLVAFVPVPPPGDFLAETTTKTTTTTTSSTSGVDSGTKKSSRVVDQVIL